jgi:hypothetical protein
VYRSSARYCLIFISQFYAKKIWTNHERRSALVRALQETSEYILPVRLDSTEIAGIRATLGYVDAKLKTPTDLGKMILEKVGRQDRSDS